MPARKYNPDKLVLAEGWARDGLTDEQIAKNLGISRSTLAEWKGRYPDFADALKKGKEIADYEVENALFKAALGFSQTEEALSNKGDVMTVERYFPPNVTAAIFWLKNRKPKEWRDKRELEHSTDPERPVEVSHDVRGHLDEYLDAIAQVAIQATGGDTADDSAHKPVDEDQADA